MWASRLFGYRVNWRGAHGRPDIAFPSRRIAVFVNGCFWHRCPICNLPIPKTNADYWRAKFKLNVERDALIRARLEETQWLVIVVWECEINADLDGVVRRIAAAYGHGRIGAQGRA